MYMAKKITTLFIEEEQLKKIKSIVALRGSSVSAFFRKKVEEEIAKSEKH